MPDAAILHLLSLLLPYIFIRSTFTHASRHIHCRFSVLGISFDHIAAPGDISLHTRRYELLLFTPALCGILAALLSHIITPPAASYSYFLLAIAAAMLISSVMTLHARCH